MPKWIGQAVNSSMMNTDITERVIRNTVSELLSDAHRARDTDKLLNDWLHEHYNVWYHVINDGHYDYAIDGKWQNKTLLWSQLLAELLAHIVKFKQEDISNTRDES